MEDPLAQNPVPAPKTEEPKLASYYRNLPRRTQVLLALLAIVVLYATAYYIGGSSYYRVHPLSEVGTTGMPEDSEDFATQEKEFYRAFDASRSMECDDTSHTPSLPPVENSVYLQNNDIDTFVCSLLKGEGKSKLANVTYLGKSAYGQYIGLGTVALNDHVYLVRFALYALSPDSLPRTDGRSDFSGFKIAQLKDAVAISSITVAPFENNKYSHLITLAGNDAQGVRLERALMGLSMYSNRYYEPTFTNPVVMNTDGVRVQEYANSDYDANPAHVSFDAPLLNSVIEVVADRAPDAQTGKYTVPPLYYPQICGYEETYADERFSLAAVDSHAYLEIDIQEGQYAILNITTPRSGYVPADWGKVMSTLALTDFRARVAAPGLYNSSSPWKYIKLDDTVVKAIGPIARASGNCIYGDANDKYRYFQYQTVKGNSVISFMFTYYDHPDEKIDGLSREDIVREILRTLVITPR